MQKLTPNGVVPETGNDRRFIIKCIYNAAEQDKQYEGILVNTWAGKTPEEAHAVLSSPGICVTSQKDKDTHLPKLKGLNALVSDAFLALIGHLREREWACMVDDDVSAKPLRTYRETLERAAARGVSFHEAATKFVMAVGGYASHGPVSSYLLRDDGAFERHTKGAFACTTVIRPPAGTRYVSAYHFHDGNRGRFLCDRTVSSISRTRTIRMGHSRRSTLRPA